MTDAIVLKLGGTTIAEEQDTLAEIAALAGEQPIVVVHGGGKRLTAWLTRLGVESRFVAGRRVTDDEALEVALGVLGGIVNAELVAALRTAGAAAVGIRGIDADVLRGRRVPELGHVIAEPVTTPALLLTLLESGHVPVVAPIGLDTEGRICNVNADDAAGAMSAALGGRLVLMTDTDGVRDADGRRVEQLTPAAAEQLISDGVITAGMVPKVRCALRALEHGDGVRSVVIADGRAERALGRALAGEGGTSLHLG